MKDYSKRNYLLILFDNVLFTNAMAFISINTVIPLFLNSLGATTMEISLASITVSIGTFITQPIFSKLAMKLSHKVRTFVKILLAQRLLFLVFALMLPMVASKNPKAMLFVFFIFWGIFNLFVGSYGPFYNSIMPKLVKSHERGRLLGAAGALGNIIAVGSSLIIGLILSTFPYPYNYSAIFIAGTLILLMDVYDFHLMKSEPSDLVTGNSISYFSYFKYVPKLLKGNRKLFKIILGCCLFTVASISLTYYSLFAIRRYHAGGREIAILTGITMIINTFSSIIFGIIGDKHGPHNVLKYSSLCGIIAGIIIISINGIFAVFIALAFSTACICGYNLSANLLIIKEAPKGELPMYISANIMITLIVSTAVTFISSLVIDHFSFTPVFAITIFAGVAAYFVFRNYTDA